MSHRRKQKDDLKEKRRKYIEEIRKKYHAEDSDLPDKLMLKMIEAENIFVKKIIEASLIDVENIDVKGLPIAIPRLWNTALLGVTGKMEMILNATDEMYIDNVDKYKNKNIAMKTKDYLEFVDVILDEISSMDRV